MAPHLSAGRIVILTRHRPIAVDAQGDYIRSVTLLDEERGVERTFSAPYILDATELGDLLELGNVEHVYGAESQAETGEPSAEEGPADPETVQGFTHVVAMDYLPGEDHTIERPAEYDRWRPRFSGLVGRVPTGDDPDIKFKRLFSRSRPTSMK